MSLVSCVISAFLWPLSLTRTAGVQHDVQWPDEQSNSWHWHDWEFESACGGLYYMSESSELIPMICEDSPSPQSTWQRISSPVAKNAWLRFPGNLLPYIELGPKPSGGGGASDSVQGGEVVVVFVPYWCVLAVTLPLPVGRLIRRRRSARRRKMNLCTDCGYDLAGNISGICPECGKAIQPADVLEKRWRQRRFKPALPPRTTPSVRPA